MKLHVRGSTAMVSCLLTHFPKTSPPFIHNTLMHYHYMNTAAKKNCLLVNLKFACFFVLHITGGDPELIRYCDNSSIHSLYIQYESAVPVISPHCSEFSVLSMSIWTSQNSSTISILVVSHRHRGKLPAGCDSFTVSVGSICLYHVSTHSPVFV